MEEKHNPVVEMTDTEPAADAGTIAALLTAYRCLDLLDLLETLLGYATEWSEASAGFLYAADESGERFVPVISASKDDKVCLGALEGIDTAEVHRLLDDRNEVAWKGLGPFAGEEENWPRKLPERAVTIPVRGSEGRTAGFILLLDPCDEASPPRKALHKLMSMAQPAVDNALRVESMKELIIMDDTASCYNRRHFEESFPEELSRAGRFRSALSLIFFDLDNLKSVNSNFGHSMGSRTLYEVSVRVSSKIRKFDKLFRFGGDEFCILLPETEWHGALEVAERVRESIAGAKFLAGLISEPEGVKVTASFGIASYPLHARTRQDMILRADRAMQRIKSGTKNSIAIAEIIGDENEP